LEKKRMQPMRTLRQIALASGVSFALCGGAAQAQQAAEVIKIGILHSLYGEMSLSETSLKDSMHMLVQLQNKNGGLLGREIVAVQRDPASDPALAAQMAREMIEEEGVVAIFGCWTSACRKAVRPVVEELNGLLFYPVQYEGQESSRNIIYTGATPNQQALPAVDFLMGARRIERWVLLGSDYVYPRVANGILSAYLQEKGVAPEDILVRYAPLDERDWQDAVAEIIAYGSQGKRTAVISTINGESNIYFYREVARAKIRSRDIPIMAFSVSEEELAGLDTAPLAGHLAAWNYFMSIDNAFNRAYIKLWQNFARNPRRVTKDPMEAHFTGFRLWVKAVEAAHRTDTDAVLEKIIDLSVDNLSGGVATVLPNHHITKQAFVGEIQDDGQFKVVWESPETIAADAWSDYLPSTAKLTADWRPSVSCGRYNTVTESCEGFVGE
jgi:urea transport system substrate-binding protein